MDEAKRLLVANTVEYMFFDPGFITMKLEHHGHKIFHRMCCFPEQVFIEFERRFSNNRESREKLYGTGKNFGYKFIERMYSYPDKSRINVDKFVSYAVDMAFDGKIGNVVNFGFDYNRMLYWLTEKDALVCKTTGYDYILQGVLSGAIAYLLENPFVEAIHVRCEGKGDDECIYVAAPDSIIKGTYKDAEILTSEINEKKENEGIYRSVNKPNKISAGSLNEIIKTGLIKYHKKNNGIFIYENKKFFLADSSIIFFIEGALKNSEEEIFNIAFKAGRESEIPIKFLRDFLSATGWGDVHISENEVIAEHFPWSNFIENFNFPFFSGMVCGIISKEKNRKIKFKDLKVENTLYKDSFTVKIRF